MQDMRDRKKTYSIVEMRRIIADLALVFDIVRLVEPQTTSILGFNEDDSLMLTPATCFNVWGRSNRCDHCTSMAAFVTGSPQNKYEFARKDLFYVVSKPFVLVQIDGSPISVVLEIVSQVTDNVLIEKNNGKSILELIDETNKKIYTDSLTQVYNRRYYDECVFWYHSKKKAPTSVGLIIMDIAHFKNINDTYGHLYGDKALVALAKLLKDTVKGEGDVIRGGGDEFAVTYAGCTREFFEEHLSALRSLLDHVVYEPGQELSFHVDVGGAFTDAFDAAPASREKLLAFFEG